MIIFVCTLPKKMILNLGGVLNFERKLSEMLWNIIKFKWKTKSREAKPFEGQLKNKFCVIIIPGKSKFSNKYGNNSWEIFKQLPLRSFNLGLLWWSWKNIKNSVYAKTWTYPKMRCILKCEKRNFYKTHDILSNIFPI